MAGWTEADAPDQSGRVAVVTGANSGLGLVTARMLASKGATVVMACRNVDKAEAAAEEVRAAAGDPDQVIVEQLDLAALASIRDAAGRLTKQHARIDLLINNAGVMLTPPQKTADGFEMQLGTNHLGHFALTGLLLGALRGVAGSRVVTVSSNGHKLGARIHFDDLQLERSYGRLKAYAQSKLANLLFTFELERRLRSAGAETVALAAHPGSTQTELTRYIPGVLRRFEGLATQSAEVGALPQVRAAIDPDATGGDYWGPGGFMELIGHPIRVRANRFARDEEVARRLWEVSEELTGVTYAL